MTRRTKLSDDDRELFRKTLGNIERIHHDRIVHERPKPAPVPYHYKSDKKTITDGLKHGPFHVSDLGSGDEIHYRCEGVKKSVFEKLRRGQYMIQAELDLHGLTILRAKNALRNFFRYCIKSNKHCVRIIHGKGFGSKSRLPVLKNELNIWLKHQDIVLAFCSARPDDGGTGAVYVLLKNIKDYSS